MKTTLSILLLFSQLAYGQWTVMQKYTEVGKGNFYLFARYEKDAKRIIQETLHDNHFKYNFDLYEIPGVLCAVSIIDPLNSEYVYIIHSFPGRQGDVPGFHILCYYMENRYRYFYDISNNEGRVSLLYDPGVVPVDLKHK